MDFNLFEYLDWEKPVTEQVKNVVLLAFDKTINPEKLIQPGHKKYWAHAALVLLLMDLERIKPHWERIFEWLQDMNWPGAYLIIELLSRLPKDELEPLTQTMKEKAMLAKDFDWADNIDLLSDEKFIAAIIADNHIVHRFW